jgi:hypothetical protein
VSEPRKQVTYFAKSIFVSKAFLFNALMGILGILAIPEVLALIPARYMPHILAFTATGNVIIRRFTVRPATFILPGETQPVLVDKVLAGTTPPEKLPPPSSHPPKPEIHD